MKKIIVIVLILVILAFLLPSLFKVIFNLGIILILIGAIVGGMYLQKAINSKERLESKFND